MSLDYYNILRVPWTAPQRRNDEVRTERQNGQLCHSRNIIPESDAPVSAEVLAGDDPAAWAQCQLKMKSRHRKKGTPGAATKQ